MPDEVEAARQKLKKIDDALRPYAGKEVSQQAIDFLANKLRVKQADIEKTMRQLGITKRD